MNKKEFFKKYVEYFSTRIDFRILKQDPQFFQEGLKLYKTEAKFSQACRDRRRGKTLPKFIEVKTAVKNTSKKKEKITIMKTQQEVHNANIQFQEICPKPTEPAQVFNPDTPILNELLNKVPQERKWTLKLDVNEKILDTLNKDLENLQNIENQHPEDAEIKRAKEIYKQTILKAFEFFEDLLEQTTENKISRFAQDKETKSIMTTVNALSDLYSKLKTVKFYDNVYHKTKQYEMMNAKSEAMLGIAKNANLTMSTEGLANQHLQEIKAIEEQVDIPAVEEFMNEVETLTASPQP